MPMRSTILIALTFLTLTPPYASAQEQTAAKSTLDDPAFKKWIKGVAALPAEKQVEAVVQKMKEPQSRI